MHTAENTQPVNCLWVASTPRSGSNIFCQWLYERARLQEPKEFLNVESLRKYGAVDDQGQFLVSSLAALFDGTPFNRRNADFPICIKAMYSQFAQARALPGVIESLAARPVVLLLRRDVVAQAVSLYIAEFTGQWTSYAQPHAAAPPYDGNAISARARRIEQHLALWRQVFAAERIDYREIYYEDLMAHPVDIVDGVIELWQLTLRRSRARHSHPHARQTTGLNADFIERYRRDQERNGGDATA